MFGRKHSLFDYANQCHADLISPLLARRLSFWLQYYVPYVLPSTAPAIKVDNCRWWGAEIVLYDPRTQSREAVCDEIAQQRGLTFISPFDDLDVMAGQGTVGLELSFQLPPVLPPNGNYIPYRLVGNMLYLSGHGPRLPDNTYRLGRIDTPDHVPAGYLDAQLAALNMLATIKLALGDLGRVEAVVKLLGMVNAGPDFRLHPKVIDGCSDVFVSVFGDKGRHPRSAVGVSSLPHGMTVEIEAVLQVR